MICDELINNSVTKPLSQHSLVGQETRLYISPTLMPITVLILGKIRVFQKFLHPLAESELFIARKEKSKFSSRVLLNL